jgi:glycine cleavage system H protein
MSDQPPGTLTYQRARFVTTLPVGYLYTPSHAWLFEYETGCWRVGLTKFATRMLGEMVDHGFSAAPGATVAEGEIVGWVEGFKAISDLYCTVPGQFLGGNPALLETISLVSRDPYGAGWLYAVHGQPAGRCLDVHCYCELLDKTIDRLSAAQKPDPPADAAGSSDAPPS